MVYQLTARIVLGKFKFEVHHLGSPKLLHDGPPLENRR